VTVAAFVIAVLAFCLAAWTHVAPALGAMRYRSSREQERLRRQMSKEFGAEMPPAGIPWQKHPAHQDHQ
jgi:hypothetical protein